MLKLNNGHRHKAMELYEDKLHQPYNYRREGIMDKIISKRIAKSENVILKYVVKIYEDVIIFMLDYVDILQNFKNFRWKNR